MATDVTKMALRTTCNENVKLKIIKIRTGCQYVDFFFIQRKPKLGRTKPSNRPQVRHSCSKLLIVLLTRQRSNVLNNVPRRTRTNPTVITYTHADMLTLTNTSKRAAIHMRVLPVKPKGGSGLD